MDDEADDDGFGVGVEEEVCFVLKVDGSDEDKWDVAGRVWDGLLLGKLDLGSLFTIIMMLLLFEGEG